MINSDEELSIHFNKIRKVHWLNYEKYINAKIIPYIKETTPHLLSSKGQRVLDIGSGPGHYNYCLQKMGHQVYGVDRKITNPTMESYKYLNEKYQLGSIYVGIESLIEKDFFGFENSFDVINFRGSIWHVLNTMIKAGIETDFLFKRLKESLSADGIIIIAIDVPSIKKAEKYMNKQLYLNLSEIREGLYCGS